MTTILLNIDFPGTDYRRHVGRHCTVFLWCVCICFCTLWRTLENCLSSLAPMQYFRQLPGLTMNHKRKARGAAEGRDERKKGSCDADQTASD